MPKENYLNRYALIITRLEKGPATYDEIADYLEQQSEIFGTNLAISQRTLQRDIKEIYSLTSYDIQNELKGDKRYFIAERPESKVQTHRLLESFQIMNAMQSIRGFEDVVMLERRRPNGMDHFHGLLYAINEKRILSFEYTRFQDDTVTNRVVHPLALKESQGRWYLIAVDTKDNRLKSFGLDRIETVDIHRARYKTKYPYDIQEHFRYAFGINTESKTTPTIVRLSFQYEQGQFIKNYPLHETQKIIEDSADAVVIELTVYITWDFVKELISYGPNMKVVNPKTLQKELVGLLKETLEQYE